MSGAAAQEQAGRLAVEASGNGAVGTAAAKPGGSFLFDLGAIDLTQRLHDRTQIATLNAHRGDMALLDHIVWISPDFRQSVALKVAKHEEFWVPGHFPGKPMYPGVLMVESAAQLAAYLYNIRQDKKLLAAFTRIDNCSFRNSVVPGDELYLLCQEVKWSRRGFVCDVQGMTNGKLTFEARISGLAIGEQTPG
jgi:3-hydroxyacyl-[acyl-carrier-protein] dehydratase